jgi:hypothetical protein
LSKTLKVGAGRSSAALAFTTWTSSAAEQIKRPIVSERGKNSGPMGTFLNFLNPSIAIYTAELNPIPIIAAMIFAFFTGFSSGSADYGLKPEFNRKSGLTQKQGQAAPPLSGKNTNPTAWFLSESW